MKMLTLTIRTTRSLPPVRRRLRRTTLLTRTWRSSKVVLLRLPRRRPNAAGLCRHPPERLQQHPRPRLRRRKRSTRLTRTWRGWPTRSWRRPSRRARPSSSATRRATRRWHTWSCVRSKSRRRRRRQPQRWAVTTATRAAQRARRLIQTTTAATAATRWDPRTGWAGRSGSSRTRKGRWLCWPRSITPRSSTRRSTSSFTGRTPPSAR